MPLCCLVCGHSQLVILVASFHNQPVFSPTIRMLAQNPSFENPGPIRMFTSPAGVVGGKPSLGRRTVHVPWPWGPPRIGMMHDGIGGLPNL